MGPDAVSFYETDIHITKFMLLHVDSRAIRFIHCCKLPEYCLTTILGPRVAPKRQPDQADLLLCT